MSQSTIIKLREQESISSGVNGSYSIPLSESLLLEEGDEVLVKSVFIDASVESFVTLSSDTTITMTTAKYFTNYYDFKTSAGATDFTNPLKSQGYPYNENLANANHVDFNMWMSPVENLLPNPTLVGAIPTGTLTYPATDLCRYWQCEEIGTLAGDFVLKGMHIYPIKGMHKYGGLGFNLTYYENINGVPTYATKEFDIKRIEWKKNQNGYFFQMDLYMSQWPGKPQYYVEVNHLPDPTLAYFGPATNTEFWKLSNNINQGGFSGDYVARLITEDLTFVIPEGKYAPAQIAQIITDKMSGLTGTDNGKVGNDYSKGEFFINSPMLSSKSQAYYNKNNNGGTLTAWAANTGTQNVILYIKERKVPTDNVMISSNFKPSTVFDATQDNFIGTNSAFLNYDPILNKLNFDAIHFPVYIAEPTGSTYEPGVTYPPDAPPNLHEPVTSYSGVGFTRLQPGWFWSQLGFTDENTLNVTVDTDNISYNPDPTLYDAANTPPMLSRSIHVVNVNSTIGENITAQFAGLDLVVDKTAKWMQPIENPDGIVTSTTDPIYASRVFGSSLEDNGYYLIDISPKFPQKLVGSANEPSSSTSNSLQSIVGKYYTQGNFLQDDGSGSISYTHVGQPQLVTQLDVRVLNADGSIPADSDIGDNNSVFVEIIKAIK